MFVIGVYDISENRVNKVRKIFDKYLFRCQNSVYTGELSPSQLKSLQAELKKVIKNKDDSVIFFTMSSEKYVKREIMGKEKFINDNFL